MVISSQEYEPAVYLPSRHVSDLIIAWNVAYQYCIYTKPNKPFLLMHTEYSVMLNLMTSAKTKNNSLCIQNNVQKKRKEDEPRKKMQRKPNRMANTAL